MNKEKGIIIIVILNVLLLILGSLIFLIYMYDYKPRALFDVDASDGRYTVKGCTLGESAIDVQVTVKIDIYDNKRKTRVTSFLTSVNNGGSKLTDKNYSIDYTEEYIKIKFYGCKEEPIEIYRFYYEDFA